MTPTIYIRCLLLPVLLWTAAARGQGFREDLAKVKASFGHEKGFSATVEVRYYKGAGDELPATVKKGNVKRLGTYYYSLFDGREYLVNPSYSVFADREHRVMVVSGTQKNGAQKDGFSAPEIDEKTERNSIIRRSTDGHTVIYAIGPKTGGTGTVLELDRDGQRLRKVTYFGGNSYGRTEIQYTYPATETALTKEEFSEARFFTKNKKTLVPAAKYAAFEINDQTQQK